MDHLPLAMWNTSNGVDGGLFSSAVEATALSRQSLRLFCLWAEARQVGEFGGVLEARDPRVSVHVRLI